MSLILELVKRCTKCGSYRELEGFPPRKNGEFGRDPQCRECYNKYELEYRNTFEGFMKRLIKCARRNGDVRSSKGRTEAGSFNLTYEYIIALWNWQNGRCYYSGIQMDPRPCTQWQCSLERINNDIGYIANNVILVCLEFNGRTKWSLDKVNQVSLLINNQSDDVSILSEINNALSKPRWQANRKQIATNDIGQYICNAIHLNMLASLLHRSIKVVKIVRN